MNSLLKQLGLIGIIPVVVIDDESNAESLVQALLDGGLPTISRFAHNVEVPLRVSLVAR